MRAVAIDRERGSDQFLNLLRDQGWTRFIDFAAGAVRLDDRDVGTDGAGDDHSPVRQARRVKQLD
jgi:hypothetical protein